MNFGDRTLATKTRTSCPEPEPDPDPDGPPVSGWGTKIVGTRLILESGLLCRVDEGAVDYGAALEFEVGAGGT